MDEAMTGRVSWLDRVVRWIDRQPLRGAWVYATLIVAQVGYINAVRWATGRLPIGDVELSYVKLSVYGVAALAALQWLDRVALGAFDRFRPALGLSDGDIARLRTELLTLPPMPVWVGLGIGLAVTIATAAVLPQSLIPTFGPTALDAIAAGLPLGVFGYGMAAVLAYHSFRQLRAVTEIHRSAVRLDLYDDGPLYAFSRLTARTGLVWLAIAWWTFIVNAGIAAENVYSFAAAGIALATAAACFSLPLLGIHGRISREKAMLMEAANRRLHQLTAELYRRVDDRDLAGIGELNTALAGVSATREQISRLPTWPWPPNLFRGFATALVVPVLVWVATRYLGQAGL